MTLDAAITLLLKAVKYSVVKNQKHIDFSVCIAAERPLMQEALMYAQMEVEKGTLTQDELKARLGLNK